MMWSHATNSIQIGTQKYIYKVYEKEEFRGEKERLGMVEKGIV